MLSVLVGWWKFWEVVATVSVVAVLGAVVLLLCALCLEEYFWIRKIAIVLGVALLLTVVALFCQSTIEGQVMFTASGELNCERFRKFVVAVGDSKLKAKWFDVCAAGEAKE